MDVETKVDLLLKRPTEELITVADARSLFETKQHPNHYIGYEISGKLHMGSLIMASFKIKDLIEAGCNTSVFLADWHAWINNKFEGDMDKMKLAGEYYREAFQLIDKKVKIDLGSDIYHDNDEYWKQVIQVSMNMSLGRAAKSVTIMGRKEVEATNLAQYIYAPMQAADIKAMDIDIAHAGMDQRKVHMLARDVFPKLNWQAPVVMHHNLLPGLIKPEGQTQEEIEESAKMSKSKPWTAIFIHDSLDEIKKKLNKAWCPEKQVETNGVLQYVRDLVFHEFKSFDIERPEKFGGNASYENYEEVEKDFVNGKIHPADLKNSVAGYLDKIIAPYRDHFEKPKYAKLLDVYKDVEITR